MYNRQVGRFSRLSTQLDGVYWIGYDVVRTVRLCAKRVGAYRSIVPGLLPLHGLYTSPLRSPRSVRWAGGEESLLLLIVPVLRPLSERTLDIVGPLTAKPVPLPLDLGLHGRENDWLRGRTGRTVSLTDWLCFHSSTCVLTG